MVFCCFPTPAIPALPGLLAATATCSRHHLPPVPHLPGARRGCGPAGLPVRGQLRPPAPLPLCRPCPGLSIRTPSTVTPNLAAQLGAACPGPSAPLQGRGGEGWVPTGCIGWPQSHRPGTGPLQEGTEIATKCKCSASGPTGPPGALLCCWEHSRMGRRVRAPRDLEPHQPLRWSRTPGLLAGQLRTRMAPQGLRGAT